MPLTAIRLLFALFFSFTFVLNREIGASGAHWLLSASLRFIFIFLILGIYLWFKKELVVIIHVIWKNIIQRFVWSFVGFGVFYSMLTYGSLFNESWLVASAWQVTIVAGALLTPSTVQTPSSSNKVTVRQIPWLPILFSTLIIIGVAVVSLPTDWQTFTDNTIIGIIPIIIAAFAYPLGNRKTMALSGHSLTSVQHVFAMTLCSLPLWMVMAGSALIDGIYPSPSQLIQSIIIAIFSGIAATALLFKACQSVKENPVQLAIIESTQSMEVVFTIVIGVLLFNHNIPSNRQVFGIGVILIGMLLNCIITLIQNVKVTSELTSTQKSL